MRLADVDSGTAKAGQFYEASTNQNPYFSRVESRGLASRLSTKVQVPPLLPQQWPITARKTTHTGIKQDGQEEKCITIPSA